MPSSTLAETPSAPIGHTSARTALCTSVPCAVVWSPPRRSLRSKCFLGTLLACSQRRRQQEQDKCTHHRENPKTEETETVGKKREKVSAVAKSQQHPTHVTDSNCQLPVVSRWLNSPVGSLLISLCASGERNRSRTLRSLLTQFCQVIGPLRFVIAEKVATFRCPRP
jgi:hypothetical protein